MPGGASAQSAHTQPQAHSLSVPVAIAVAEVTHNDFCQLLDRRNFRAQWYGLSTLHSPIPPFCREEGREGPHPRKVSKNSHEKHFNFHRSVTLSSTQVPDPTASVNRTSPLLRRPWTVAHLSTRTGGCASTHSIRAVQDTCQQQNHPPHPITPNTTAAVLLKKIRKGWHCRPLLSPCHAYFY